MIEWMRTLPPGVQVVAAALGMLLLWVLGGPKLFARMANVNVERLEAEGELTLAQQVNELRDEVSETRIKQAQLEADMVALASLLSSIMLCDSCRDRNQRVMEMTAKIFERHAPNID